MIACRVDMTVSIQEIMYTISKIFVVQRSHHVQQ